MVRGFLDIGVTPLVKVTYNRLLPYVSLSTETKEFGSRAHSIAYQLSNDRVSRTISPVTSTHLYSRHVDDNHFKSVASYGLEERFTCR